MPLWRGCRAGATVGETHTNSRPRPKNARRKVLNMHFTVFAMVVAIVVAFGLPASADDRPADPFGNHTVELNKEAPLFTIWNRETKCCSIRLTFTLALSLAITLVRKYILCSLK